MTSSQTRPLEPFAVDTDELEHFAETFLGELGFDMAWMAGRVGDLANTPARFARALLELTRGLREEYDPAADLARDFEAPTSSSQGMVICRDVPFRTLCEHHFLPFTGRATVGYLARPGGRVVGLSKLARVVQGYATAPTMQERLGQQVVDALVDHLNPQGCGVLIEAEHACLTIRGALATGASMVTHHVAGSFEDGTPRAEFLALARH